MSAFAIEKVGLDVVVDSKSTAYRFRLNLLVADNSKHEKSTNCGTKAADVLDKFSNWQTLMRIH